MPVADVLLINKMDDVVVALRDLKFGSIVETEGLRLSLRDDVPIGHKIAVRDIKKGDKVTKYGFTIGVSTRDIRAGEWVHTHNISTTLSGLLEYKYEPVELEVRPGEKSDLTFPGYVRKNGEVGIRNEIWIINTVGCCNKVAERLAQKARERFVGRNIDGIFQFSHPHGCSQLGDDHLRTQKILAGLVCHPNAGGVLVMGLGCENNNIEEFKRVLGPYDPERVKFLAIQEVEDEINAGLKVLEELVAYAEGFTRTPVPVGCLKVGLKCGGSDAFSGLTANPLVGVFSDLLVKQGGITMLTEVPEMFGAETILMNRAINEEVFVKIVQLINGFKDYFLRYNQVIYENPSPGNKKGGISTLEEKSLGCIQKGGRGPVVDVLAYGERAGKKGLNLVEGPGNDMVAVTALVAAGAHLVLFTTGRGTPLGGPVPTVKISSNSWLAEHKKSWIDFDAGKLLEGVPMKRLAGEFFDYVLRVASGEIRTKNEENDYREIAIFKEGVTL
ncbi:UxaA family hydrolase [Calderihabitans maritimus]|uniref:Altronate hydrolase n=1 Tax=Calderihabitans maritimus TaxID=1246530 RepID=A0A1Z5HX61_9FIRM|nr:altronate dehydratase family protein [Calderihabitans maritimus]GAW94116.1 altronate hydrolase [Calderihabitans maritimus]